LIAATFRANSIHRHEIIFRTATSTIFVHPVALSFSTVTDRHRNTCQIGIFLDYWTKIITVIAFTWSFHVHVALIYGTNEAGAVMRHKSMLITAAFSVIVHPVAVSFWAARIGYAIIINSFVTYAITECLIENISPVAATLKVLWIASTVPGSLIEEVSPAAVWYTNVWAIRIKVIAFSTFTISLHIYVMHVWRTRVTALITSHVVIFATATSSGCILPMTGAVFTVFRFDCTVLKYSVEIIAIGTIFETRLGHIIPEKTFVTVTMPVKIIVV